jgi:integrase
MKKGHHKLGAFNRVAEHLYRYSASKKYYAVFKSNGKTRWIPLKTTDRELAGRRAKDEIAKHKKTDAKASSMTLSELLVLYEQSIQGLAPHTQGTRRSILKVFKSSWSHGLDIQARAVSKGQLSLWLSEQRARLRNSSYNEYTRFVRQLFQIALDHQAIGESPAVGFKELRVEKPIRTTPTWDQFLAIVTDIRNQSLNVSANDSADLVEFMGRAGVGTAECANLLGERIDFAGSRITLCRKKTDVGYTIPIYPQLKPLIDRFREEEKIKVGKPVFQIKDPKKALDAACKRLGLPHFSSRALRRCFITRAIELGVDFKTISAWQGHQDGGVLIARTYTHLRNEHSDNMAKKLVA